MFWRVVLEPEGRQLHTLPGLFALSISWRLFIRVLRIVYLICSLFAQYVPSARKSVSEFQIEMTFVPFRPFPLCPFALLQEIQPKGSQRHEWGFTSHPEKGMEKMLLFCQAPDSVAAVLRLWLLDAEDTSEGHVARVPVASTVVRKKVKCRVLLRALEDEGLHEMRRGAYDPWQLWWWLGIRIQVDKCIFQRSNWTVWRYCVPAILCHTLTKRIQLFQNLSSTHKLKTNNGNMVQSVMRND